MTIPSSNQWAESLTELIDELGGNGPSLWVAGITPTPEKVVEYLREHIKYREKIAADNELNACCEWVSIQLNCTSQEHLVPHLRTYRRPPQPSLKTKALEDFENVKKICNSFPEILYTIENALKSIPE